MALCSGWHFADPHRDRFPLHWVDCAGPVEEAHRVHQECDKWSWDTWWGDGLHRWWREEIGVCWDPDHWNSRAFGEVLGGWLSDWHGTSTTHSSSDSCQCHDIHWLSVYFGFQFCLVLVYFLCEWPYSAWRTHLLGAMMTDDDAVPDVPGEPSPDAPQQSSEQPSSELPSSSSDTGKGHIVSNKMPQSLALVPYASNKMSSSSWSIAPQSSETCLAIVPFNRWSKRRHASNDDIW